MYCATTICLQFIRNTKKNYIYLHHRINRKKCAICHKDNEKENQTNESLDLQRENGEQSKGEELTVVSVLLFSQCVYKATT